MSSANNNVFDEVTEIWKVQIVSTYINALFSTFICGEGNAKVIAICQELTKLLSYTR